MSRQCRVCGASLPGEVLGGHCPQCLVQISLDCFRSVGTEPGTVEPLPRPFGQYELVAEVARGGMGVVYRARQKALGRQVALKMILSGPFASRAALERFRAEARVAGSLQHPGIVAIHEVGEAEGQPYFTMDFVEGRNLAEHVRDGPLPPQRAARYVQQVASAVAYAHQCAVLHRDLKPANILIDRNDQPRITDFGLAKQLSPSAYQSSRPELTLTGQALGSPHYMAPEQVSGQNIGPGADIYSLGAILYHLLTGRPPFAAGSVGETLHQVLHNEPPRPRVLDPSLPMDLETICLKCLEKEPARRFSSADMVAEELERFLSGEPLISRPISSLERGWRWCQRNQALAALGGLAALLPVAVILALVMLAVSNLRIRQERDRKDLALRERATALEATRKSEQQARDQLFLALRNEARARRFSRQMGQRFDSLKALAEAARIRPDENLRDEAIAALALADVQRGPGLQTHWASNTLAMAFDELYQRYAKLNTDGSISIRKVPTDAEIQKLNPGAGGTALGWQDGSRLLFSPDGQFLAQLDYSDNLRVWRLADGQQVLRDAPGSPLVAAFSPNGRWLVMAGTDSFTRFDLSSGRAVNHWAAPKPAFSLAFNPDNCRVAVGDIESESVSVYDSAEGREVAVVSSGQSKQEVVAWHPAGKFLALAGSEPRIQIWDVERMVKVATLEGHAQQVTVLSFHPDSGLLASGSWDGVIRIWDPLGARQVMEIPFGPDIQFSKDGRWLGFRGLSDRIELWAVTANQEYWTVGQGSAYEGDLSPDGRFLAMGMKDGLRVWDLLRRKQVVYRALEGTFAVFFAGGGRQLVTCSPKHGLQCWPVEITEDATAREFTLGPPRDIPLPWRPQAASGARLGRTIGIISEEAGQAVVFSLSSDTFGPMLNHPRGNSIALSPDGRWLATAGWHSSLVRLWETSSGALVHEWSIGGQTLVSFTPEGRELIISSPGEFRFWALDTLTPTLHLPHDVLYPGHLAFSPDLKLVAAEMTPGIIHLLSRTGRTVAKLENPFRDRSTWMAFTADGTQLITASRYAKTIQAWDLAKIRGELKTLGLDWDWPEFTAAMPGAAQPHATHPGPGVATVGNP